MDLTLGVRVCFYLFIYFLSLIGNLTEGMNVEALFSLLRLTKKVNEIK